jgi:hypothetical protein
MIWPLLGRCISVFAVACVLALFFFPLAHGPFQATHGPTTAFRAKQAFLLLIFAMFAAALRILAALVPQMLFIPSCLAWNIYSSQRTLGVLSQGAILRC